MVKLFKGIYVGMTCYSRDDQLCTRYGRVEKDGSEWQAIRLLAGGSWIIKRFGTREEAEAALENGNEVTKSLHL